MVSDVAEQRETMPGRNGGTLRRIPKGVSGNPKGRPNAGAAVREWFNALQETEPAELRAIAADDNETPNRKAAAVQWLQTFGCDMADLTDFLNGTATLAELRDRGVNTRAIKKATIRRYKTTSKGGRVEETENITLEILNSQGEAVDRISDRCDGKPLQRVDVRTTHVDPADIAARMRQLFLDNPGLQYNPKIQEKMREIGMLMRIGADFVQPAEVVATLPAEV